MSPGQGHHLALSFATSQVSIPAVLSADVQSSPGFCHPVLQRAASTDSRWKATLFLLARKTQTVLKQRGKGEGGRDVNPKDHGVCRVRAPRGSPDEAPGVRARFGLIFSSVSKEVGQLGSSVLLVAHHASSASTRKGRLEDAHEGKRGDFLQDSLFFPVEHHAW